VPAVTGQEGFKPSHPFTSMSLNGAGIPAIIPWHTDFRVLDDTSKLK